MPTMRIPTTPGTRLKTGASILSTAEVIEVRSVKTRLATFTHAQKSYAEAQQKVEAAQAELSAAQKSVTACVERQDAAVEDLARALVFEGQPRVKPFAAFGAPGPSAIINMAVAAEVKAIVSLLAAIHKATDLSKATLQAAKNLEQAVGAVKEALAPLPGFAAVVHEARRRRDALADVWDNALAALKRGARAAVDDGAPHLYGILFEERSRQSGKSGRKKNIPEPPAEAPSAPAQTAS